MFLNSSIPKQKSNIPSGVSSKTLSRNPPSEYHPKQKTGISNEEILNKIEESYSSSPATVMDLFSLAKVVTRSYHHRQGHLTYHSSFTKYRSICLGSAYNTLLFIFENIIMQCITYVMTLHKY